MKQKKHQCFNNKPCDEVLGAAQFTERTMHKCQKLSKVVKSQTLMLTFKLCFLFSGLKLKLPTMKAVCKA